MASTELTEEMLRLAVLALGYYTLEGDEERVHRWMELAWRLVPLTPDEPDIADQTADDDK